ncbi:MAG: phosphoenolpyruvate--protein phosphotransferase [bacterium]
MAAITRDAGSGVDEEVILHGIGVSPGLVVGTAIVVRHERQKVLERFLSVDEVAQEIVRLEGALIETRRQIREIQRNLERQAGQGGGRILDMHLMVLEDDSFIGEVVREINHQKKNAEAVIWATADRFATMLAGAGDDYLMKERGADVRDVARRIVRNLIGSGPASLDDMPSKSILIANDLAPSETASLRKDLVIGLATDVGSPTSHSAMMARAMQIPAVVGLHDISQRVLRGEQVLIDGNKGVLIIRPSQETIEAYNRLLEERKSIEIGLQDLKNAPARTKDGETTVALAANIEWPDDVEAVISNGAEGVGLFRTEYAYLAASELPSEDSLAAGYTRVAERLSPAPVIIRTIDVGGDKLASCLGMPLEANPFLGLRSIRLALAEPEMFKTQLRAILRASVHGNVKLMYPMISCAEEVIQANELLVAAKRELAAENVPFDSKIEVGAMIEIPAAAVTADLIAPFVKFFSIGTNDLIQYSMAVDRVNERVAYLYQPTHPAILRLIKTTIEAGHGHGVWVGVCGEMAADPIVCPLLLGLGIDELSVSPSAVPVIKDIIRSITMSQARDLAALAMEARSAVEVLEACRDLIRQTAPEILELTG